MSTTTVSVTVQDPSGQAWANGELSYRIAANKPVFFNDVELTDNYFELTTIELDGSGSATFSLPDCAQLRPAGTPWQITVNPNAYTEGITLYLFITGAIEDISTAVNAAIAQPVVLPLIMPFAYRDSNIELQTKVGEMYWRVDGALRLYTGTDWITINGAGGVTQIIAGTNITISPTSGVGAVTINSSGGGITQLHGDVLAGPGTGNVDSTCVEVHASDDQGSLFYIDTETPPENSTHSVGLFARNISGSDFLGSADIFYDNDNWDTWILRLQYWLNGTPKTPADISYILDSYGLWFINNLSGLAGNPQFLFGNKLDGTGQLLGLYYNSSTPSIWQIGTRGSEAHPFLVLGNSGDNVQLAGVSLATLALMFSVGGIINHIAVAPSAATMAAGELNLVTQISGTAVINTITPPVAPQGSFTGNPAAQSCIVQATGAWSVTNAGNINTPPFTATIGSSYLFVCADGTTWQIYDLTQLSIPAGTFLTALALGTPNQNNRKAPITVTTTCTTSGTSVGSLTAKIGPTNPPTNTILINENTASVGSANVGITFGVPTGWFYEVDSSGDITGVTSNYETVMS